MKKTNDTWTSIRLRTETVTQLKKTLAAARRKGYSALTIDRLIANALVEYQVNEGVDPKGARVPEDGRKAGAQARRVLQGAGA